jgi:hypothetical protein
MMHVQVARATSVAALDAAIIVAGQDISADGKPS